MAESPEKIDNKYLQRFDEFLQFQGRKNTVVTSTRPEAGETTEEQTPLEQLESSFRALSASLAQDLLEQVKRCSPRFFEKLVLDLLLAMGYGSSRVASGQLTQYTNDKGIDGIIKEDSLGLDKIYLQAKRWDGKVGRKELQGFVGALAGQRAKKGVFITTSSFTDTAISYVQSELGIDTKVVLIDGLELAELMMELDIGVFTEESFPLKRIDSDYFEDDEY